MRGVEFSLPSPSGGGAGASRCHAGPGESALPSGTFQGHSLLPPLAPCNPSGAGDSGFMRHAVPELPPPQLKPLPCSWPVCALLRRAVQREAVHTFHRQKEVLCPYRFGPYRASPVACAGAGQRTASAKEVSPSLTSQKPQTWLEQASG